MVDILDEEVDDEDHHDDGDDVDYPGGEIVDEPMVDESSEPAPQSQTLGQICRCILLKIAYLITSEKQCLCISLKLT